MFISSPYSNVFVRYVRFLRMVEDHKFSAFQEKKTTPYYSMLLCLLKKWNRRFILKNLVQVSAVYVKVCMSYDFINKRV